MCLSGGIHFAFFEKMSLKLLQLSAQHNRARGKENTLLPNLSPATQGCTPARNVCKSRRVTALCSFLSCHRIPGVVAQGAQPTQARNKDTGQ